MDPVNLPEEILSSDFQAVQPSEDLSEAVNSMLGEMDEPDVSEPSISGKIKTPQWKLGPSDESTGHQSDERAKYRLDTPVN